MKEVSVALVVITLAITPSFGYGKARADETLSLEEARTALCQPQFHWDCDWVVAKAQRESTLQPGAINWDCSNDGTYRYRCYGLLQLEEGWAPGGNVAALLDLRTNIQIAYQVYMSSGIGAWGG